MNRWRPWAPAALLAAGTFFAYGGPLLFRLGFYTDDWWFLSVMRFAPPGFSGALGALLTESKALLLRPFDGPLIAALYSLFGLSPLGWQCATMLAVFAVALGAERLLRLCGAPPAVALLGAILALAFPNKDGAMFWPMAGIIPVSLAFFVWATVFHAEWVREGGRGRLAASTGCLLVSLGFYDQSFFQFAAWALLPPAPGPEGRRRSIQGLGAAAALTVLFAAYKFVVVPRIFDVVFNKSVVLSPLNSAIVVLRAIEASLGPRLAASALGAAAVSLLTNTLTAAAAFGLPWMVHRLWPEEPEAPPGVARRLAFFGLALFWLGYLPIMVSNYRPTPLTHENRINFVPSLGLALAAASLALSGARRFVWRRAGAALAGVCLAAHAGFAGYWAEAAKIQDDIRRVVEQKAADWPADTVLLIRQRELYIGGHAPLFTASWDATGAVRLWTGDGKRSADALRPGVGFFPGGVVISQRLLAYDKVRVLDLEARSIAPLTP